jgi:hypothetical protein
MSIQLSPAALRQANLLLDGGCRGSGFLVGAFVGRHLLIDELVAAPFTARTLPRVATAAGRVYGERLQGVFFCRRPAFASDWFLEQLVLELDTRGIACSRCVFDDGTRSARLEPIREAEGDA